MHTIAQQTDTSLCPSQFARETSCVAALLRSLNVRSRVHVLSPSMLLGLTITSSQRRRAIPISRAILKLLFPAQHLQGTSATKRRWQMAWYSAILRLVISRTDPSGYQTLGAIGSSV